MHVLLTNDSKKLLPVNIHNFAHRTRIGLHAKDSTSPVVILERSLYSERFCFVQVSFMSDIDMYSIRHLHLMGLDAL